MANMIMGKAPTSVQRLGHRILTARPLRRAVGYAAHYANRLGLGRSEGIWAPIGATFLEPKGSPTEVSGKIFDLLASPAFEGLPEAIRARENIDQAVTAFSSRTLSGKIGTRDIEAFGARLGLRGQDVADLRRAIEQDRGVTSQTLVEKAIESARQLGLRLMEQGTTLQMVDPVDTLQVMNEPLQDARTLTSINEVRRIEAIDRDTGEPVEGLEIYRVFRSDMPPAMQKTYDRLGVQYVFYAVDRRAEEDGGTGLRYSYSIVMPVANTIVGKEATLGGCRSRDYEQSIGAPPEIEALPQVWKQVYDNMWLAYGMMIKSAGAGADVRGEQADWKYGITLGGGKSVEHQPEAWKVEHITTDQTSDPAKIALIEHRDARDLLKGTVIDTLCRWELAPLTAEDMDNGVAPRLLSMGIKTDYLVGDPRLGLKGEYPTTFTADNVFNDMKALIEAGLWTGVASLGEACVFVEGYGGVSSYLIDQLVEAGVNKIVVTELDNQTRYDKFEVHTGYAGKPFDGRTKIEYIQQVLIPEAQAQGVEVVLIEPRIADNELVGLQPHEIISLRADRLPDVRLGILRGDIQRDVNIYSPNAGGDTIQEAEAKAIVNRGLWVAGAANNVITSRNVEDMVGVQVVPSSLINDGGVIAASAHVNGDTAATLAAKKTEVCPAKAVAVHRLAQQWDINYWAAFRRVTDLLIEQKKVEDRKARYSDSDAG